MYLPGERQLIVESHLWIIHRDALIWQLRSDAKPKRQYVTSNVIVYRDIWVEQ